MVRGTGVRFPTSCSQAFAVECPSTCSAPLIRSYAGRPRHAICNVDNSHAQQTLDAKTKTSRSVRCHGRRRRMFHYLIMHAISKARDD